MISLKTTKHLFLQMTLYYINNDVTPIDVAGKVLMVYMNPVGETVVAAKNEIFQPPRAYD
jgi:hypothetical protein